MLITTLLNQLHKGVIVTVDLLCNLYVCVNKVNRLANVLVGGANHWKIEFLGFATLLCRWNLDIEENLSKRILVSCTLHLHWISILVNHWSQRQNTQFVSSVLTHTETRYLVTLLRFDSLGGTLVSVGCFFKD